LVPRIVFTIAVLLASTQNSQADLFVSEFTSVVRYDQFTGAFIDVFVSPGNGGLENATGMSFGPDGNLYVASFGGSREILRYNGKTGDFIDVFVTTSSGGLGAPNDVTFGPDGNLYVADGFYGTNSILRYNGKTGDFIDVFATGGGMRNPSRLKFGPDANLFVGNATTSDVLRYHGDTGLPYPSSGNSGAIFVPGIQGPFNTALTFGPGGDLFVLSGATTNVLRYNGKTGEFIGTFVSNVSNGDLIFGPDRNLYITNYLGDSVLRYNGRSGVFMDTFVSPNSGGLSRPSSLTFNISPVAVLVNDLVTFEPDPDTFSTTSDTTGCPSSYVGKFSFESTLTNIRSSTLTYLQVEVAKLTRRNLLATDEGLIGEGESFPVPEAGGYYSDGVLSPGEFVEVPFTVCLRKNRPFNLLVDVLGRISDLGSASLGQAGALSEQSAMPDEGE
jgi:streptogramin lyase